jgi:hypothetical protein
MFPNSRKASMLTISSGTRLKIVRYVSAAAISPASFWLSSRLLWRARSTKKRSRRCHRDSSATGWLTSRSK